MNIKNKISNKAIIFTVCLLIGGSLMGCSSNNTEEKEANTPKLENFMDVRTAKIISMQSAMLKFTTENKAGSICSVKLEPVNGKYVYTIDAISKKKKNVILTIDASTGKITNTEEAALDISKKRNLIDFVPVLDLDKAAKFAISKSKNENVQVVSYKLYSKNGLNLYEFELADGTVKFENDTKTENKNDNSEKQTKSFEKITIDAETGKVVDPSTLQSSSDTSINSNTTQGSGSTSTSSDTSSQEE
ncbi:PepSY domain-containing protein [Peptostreptococcus porci]|uniref:PepSY domain-containing protein n=1 Tax=Peptostreptococcus porci TaxID=2652282 RepID=UPI002A90D1AB|nr:PepSY domain-containing protein [Peptostreptococcus porci]MDY6232840.1 PepSY domain-containing protein [Peptostreptococcus porci]